MICYSRIIDWFRKRKVLRMGLSIGENCEILNGYRFGSEPYLISIGNHVRICDGVRFITHDGGMWVLRKKYTHFSDADCFGEIVVGNNVHIGTDVTIMPGVTIGNDCIIGCNAVVTHDVADATVVAGVPARYICTMEQYRMKHETDTVATKSMDWNKKRLYLTKTMKLTQH